MTSLDIRLEEHSRMHPYEQIRHEIARRISSGELAAGAQLPAVRKLAAQLDVAAGTVARAYRDLKSAGVVVTVGRHGTIVATHSDFPAPVMLAASDYVRTAQSAGMEAREILECVGEILTPKDE